MEALTRQEYPAMLERLQPAAAVSKLNERVKKIWKVNSEVADWLQERRKVEDAYVTGLKKLARRPLQEIGGELGVFDSPWKKIVSSTESIASSHATFSQRIDKDVETPLRTFAATNREMTGMATIQANLASLAKTQEDAQDKADKLGKKGGKANSLKVEAANTKLQEANQQWDTQAPFIYESLQSLDETRLNHLRDVLTQYETLEADQLERSRATVEQTLGSLLEIDTSVEIQAWSQANIAGRLPRDRSTRQHSIAGSSTANAVSHPPPTPSSVANESLHERTSEQSGRLESLGEKKLKSRFGTMLGRRRQSIHGGFARAPSPSKGFPSLPNFSRNNSSRDGRPSPSPRASSNNLRETPSHDNRLSSLVEAPSPTSPHGNNLANGSAQLAPISDSLSATSATSNGIPSAASPDLSDVQPPPGPPPSHLKENQKDSEGFTVPPTPDDPISQAQHEAAQDGEQPQFNLNIRNEPIPEQDADAQAALSNVANTLRSSQAVTPSRKVGTTRGRRDVRNTIYMPSPTSLDVATSEHALPPSPGIQMGRAATLAALSSSDHNPPIASDTTSIRSGHSVTSNPLVKHADMHGPGLNASLLELVSATFEGGEIKSVSISGEIALVYNKVETDSMALSAFETIKINNFPNLEAIGPNKTFIHQATNEKPDEFSIDVNAISPKPLVGFTYRVHIDESNISLHAPILVKTAWKPAPNKHDLGLVIEYFLNPAFSSATESFRNVTIVAHSTGARAAGCQTKPSGTYYKERSFVVWRLGDVTLNNQSHKILAKFIGAEGSVPEPGHIELKWELPRLANLEQGSSISLSKLNPGKGKEKEEIDDPFADDSISPKTLSGSDAWVDVETSKKIASGKYEARVNYP